MVGRCHENVFNNFRAFVDGAGVDPELEEEIGAFVDHDLGWGDAYEW